MRQKNKQQMDKLLHQLTANERDMLKRVWKSYVEICKALRGLTITIEHGKPLPGACMLCPEVKINKNNE